MEAFVGTVMPVAFSSPVPDGWLPCSGQLVSINACRMLYSLIGTTYGGDGKTTFGIPDLRGRLVVGAMGTGTGLSPVSLGQQGGAITGTVYSTSAVSVTLTSANMPPHTHEIGLSGSSFSATSTLYATTQTSGGTAPALGATLCGTSSASGPAQAAVYLAGAPSPSSMVPLNSGSVTTTIGGDIPFDSSGEGQPITNSFLTTNNVSVMQPCIGITFLICYQGLFPSVN